MSIEDRGEDIMSEEIIGSPDTLRSNRIPPSQHSIDYWPVLHFGKTPTIETGNWTFKIFGLVNKGKTLKYMAIHEKKKDIVIYKTL